MLLPIAAMSVAAILSGSGGEVRAQDSPAFEPTLDELEDLPAGPGQEETFYTCTACHGLALIESQGMDRLQWDDTIRLMVESHNMVEPSAAERELLVSYLAEHFPPRQGPRQRGWRNPFLNR